TAWSIAVGAWGVGVVLGSTRVQVGKAVTCALVAAAAFVGIFAARAPRGNVQFRQATPWAGLLFVVAFSFTVIALASIRARDVSREVLRRPVQSATEPSIVLAVTALGAAAVALAL